MPSGMPPTAAKAAIGFSRCGARQPAAKAAHCFQGLSGIAASLKRCPDTNRLGWGSLVFYLRLYIFGKL
jgi:hypothetical protein